MASDEMKPPGPVAPGLPVDVRDRLIRQLRAALNETEERPAFLGDPAIPSHLEPHVARLLRAERDRVGQKGLEAVQAALGFGEGAPGAATRSGSDDTPRLDVAAVLAARADPAGGALELEVLLADGAKMRLRLSTSALAALRAALGGRG